MIITSQNVCTEPSLHHPIHNHPRPRETEHGRKNICLRTNFQRLGGCRKWNYNGQLDIELKQKSHIRGHEKWNVEEKMLLHVPTHDASENVANVTNMNNSILNSNWSHIVVRPMTTIRGNEKLNAKEKNTSLRSTCQCLRRWRAISAPPIRRWTFWRRAVSAPDISAPFPNFNLFFELRRKNN